VSIRQRIALGTLCLVVLAACGTRLDDAAFVEAGVATEDGGLAPAGNGNGQSTGTTVAGGSATPSGGTTPGGGAAPGSEGGTGDGGTGSAASGPNEASDTGITETTIRIGNITAVNGVLGDAFEPSLRGLRAWVEATNAAGGINGRTVELVTCDDREDRARSLECARQLVEDDQVFAFVANNSRAQGGSAQYIDDQGVPVVGGLPITNSYYRYGHFWTLYGPGYPREGDVVGFDNQLYEPTAWYRWFRENLQVSNAAVLSYGDIAESSQAGARFSRGLEIEGFAVQTYSVNFANPQFDQIVADMQRRGTQMVIDTMDDGANRKLCDTMQRRGFQPVAKVSTVVAAGDSIGTDFSDICRNIIFIPGLTRVYSDTSSPAVAAFREAYARYQPGEELHQWALEGWTAGVMIGEAIASLGPAPTRQGVEDWLRALNDYSAGGLLANVDYQVIDPNSEIRPYCFGIGQWSDEAGGWVQASGSFPTCYEDNRHYPNSVQELGN
jgi:branched-chain amino acid transport system substrate-binding protein